MPRPELGSVGRDALRRNGEIQVEFAAQFLVPLRNQRCRHQNQHPPRHAAQQILAEQQARLDRFPQADLVRQQHPAAKMPQHLADGFDLMRQMLDAVQSFQTQQLVEPAQQTQPCMFLMQPEVTRIGGMSAPPGTARRERRQEFHLELTSDRRTGLPFLDPRRFRGSPGAHPRKAEAP